MAYRNSSDRNQPRLSTAILSRFAAGAITLLVVSALVFAATQWLPGDAARSLSSKSVSAPELESIRHQLGLDRPLLVQYFQWLDHALQGDFGRSMMNGAEISTLLVQRMRNSFLLVLLVVVVVVPLAAAAGYFAAAKRGGRIDRAGNIAVLALAATPEFIIATILILLFATNLFRMLPPVSMVRTGHSPFDRPQIMILPVATLVLVVFPYLFRVIRAQVIQVLDSDYIEMARLNGVAGSRLMFGHVLPNVLAPIVQVVGLVVAFLAGGVVVVEYVFGFAGLGNGLVNAVATRDLPAVQGYVLVLATFYIAVNILTDFLSLLMTPRARLHRGAE